MVMLRLLLILAPILANAAFFGLGSIFDYPDILQRPTEEILARFIANEGAIMTWFAVLAASAALMAPISVLLRRRGASRGTVLIGIAAAVVQVVGLSRWFLLMPGIAARGDLTAFATAHEILGTFIGETMGYLLTGIWTFRVIREVDFVRQRKWLAVGGGISAALILFGVVIPFGVPGADQANFIGYVLWSAWLIACGVVAKSASIDNRG